MPLTSVPKAVANATSKLDVCKFRKTSRRLGDVGNFLWILRRYRSQTRDNPIQRFRTGHHNVFLAMNELHGQTNAEGRKIGVIVSRWNELVTKQLLEGALDQLKISGDPEVTVVHVPGTWELPAAAVAMVKSGKAEGIVALGCILQGATPHAQMLARDVSSALMELQNKTGVPIGWGVLTPENQEQAFERAGMKLGNKGREAALACIEMVSLLEQISR